MNREFSLQNPMANYFKGAISLAHLWSHDLLFLAHYKQVHEIVVCSPDRCYILWQLARMCDSICEIGVAKGGTAKLMYLASQAKNLHLFDTFEGVPKNTEGFPSGSYKGSLRRVQELLPTAVCTKGKIEEVGVTFWKYDLVHIDVDLAYPTNIAIDKFWPMVKVGGVMVVDDYNTNLIGITDAVDSRFSNVLQVSYAQAIIIKRK
jgi:hypothetical protein